MNTDIALGNSDAHTDGLHSGEAISLKFLHRPSGDSGLSGISYAVRIAGEVLHVTVSESDDAAADASPEGHSEYVEDDGTHLKLVHDWHPEFECLQGHVVHTALAAKDLLDHMNLSAPSSLASDIGEG